MFTLPTLLRHAPFVLFIGGILAYGAAFAGYLLVKFDLLNFIGDLNHDDAFYYFQIAYHLAEGKFSTFDGGITRTNGYHPLWLLLITPFYWIFDKEGALFAIKALEIMLVAGGVALIAVAARLARLPWYLLFALLPMLYQTHAFYKGLEAAAALFMLGLLFLALLLYARNPERWTWPLAVVAFALPWVRLEYIAISLAATTALLLLEWSRRERPAGASRRAALIFTPPPRTFVPIISAVAGILTYFIYNKLVFGGIVPVSGATKRAWAQELFENEGGYNLFQNFQAIRQIEIFNNGTLLTALAICVGFLLVGWLARRSRSREDWLLLAFLVGGFSVAMGHIAKFAQTVLQVYPFIQGKFDWYFVPAYLMLALTVPFGCYTAVYFIRRFIGPRSAPAANVLTVGIVVVSAVFLLSKVDFADRFRVVESWSDSTNSGNEWIGTVYGGSLVMNRALPEDSVIGSWDAGVAGYFSRFPVVNLDGLVNSYDYFHATNVERDGYAVWKEEFKPLYQEFGITHFANVTRTGFTGELLYAGQQFSREGREIRFNLWSADRPQDADADPAAWFWQRMEPHFDDQGDGVGLLVDGRLAQAFTRDCAPGELIVWDWSGAGPPTAPQPWTQTETGLCAEFTVLPHDATPPVQWKSTKARDYLTSLVGAGPPAVSGDFDVYHIENRLLYVREWCAPADTATRFFLHLEPVEVQDLPEHRRQDGFDNLDFTFDQYGDRFGALCLAAVPLPEYGIADFRTGPYAPVASGFSDYLADFVGDHPPALSAEFDVYLVANRLIYAKEPCTPADLEARFFALLYPVELNDLPEPRQQYGFDSLDFTFDQYGNSFDDLCLVELPLPEYAITSIYVGQYVLVEGGFEHIWEGEIRLRESK